MQSKSDSDPHFLENLSVYIFISANISCLFYTFLTYCLKSWKLSHLFDLAHLNMQYLPVMILTFTKGLGKTNSKVPL